MLNPTQKPCRPTGKTFWDYGTSTQKGASLFHGSSSSKILLYFPLVVAFLLSFLNVFVLFFSPFKLAFSSWMLTLSSYSDAATAGFPLSLHEITVKIPGKLFPELGPMLYLPTAEEQAEGSTTSSSCSPPTQLHPMTSASCLPSDGTGL